MSAERASTACDIRCGPGGPELSVPRPPEEGRQVFLCYFSGHTDMVVEWLTCGHTLSDRHQAPADELSGGRCLRAGSGAEGCNEKKKKGSAGVPIAGCEFGWWAGSDGMESRFTHTVAKNILFFS